MVSVAELAKRFRLQRRGRRIFLSAATVVFSTLVLAQTAAAKESAEDKGAREAINALLGTTAKQSTEIKVADLKRLKAPTGVQLYYSATIGKVKNAIFARIKGKDFVYVTLQSLALPVPIPGGAKQTVALEKPTVVIAAQDVVLSPNALPKDLAARFDKQDLDKNRKIEIKGRTNLFGTLNLGDPKNKWLKRAVDQLGLKSNKVRLSGQVSTGWAKLIFSGNLAAIHDAGDFDQVRLLASFPDGAPPLAKGILKFTKNVLEITGSLAEDKSFGHLKSPGNAKDLVLNGSLLVHFSSLASVQYQSVKYACQCLLTVNPPAPEAGDRVVELSRGLVEARKLVSIDGVILGPLPDLQKLPIPKLPKLSAKMTAATVHGGLHGPGWTSLPTDLSIAFLGDLKIGAKPGTLFGMLLASRVPPANADKVRFVARLDGDISVPDLIGTNFGIPELDKNKLRQILLTRYVVRAIVLRENRPAHFLAWWNKSASGKINPFVAVARPESDIAEFVPAVKGTPIADLKLLNTATVLSLYGGTMTGFAAINTNIGTKQLPAEFAPFLGGNALVEFPLVVKGGVTMLSSVDIKGSGALAKIWSQVFEPGKDNILLYGTVAKEAVTGGKKSFEEIMKHVDLWAQAPDIKKDFVPPMTEVTAPKLHIYGAGGFARADVYADVKLLIPGEPPPLRGTIALAGDTKAKAPKDKGALQLIAESIEPWSHPYGIPEFTLHKLRYSAIVGNKAAGGQEFSRDATMQKGVGNVLLGKPPVMTLTALTTVDSVGKVDTQVSVWAEIKNKKPNVTQVGFRLLGKYKLNTLSMAKKIKKNPITDKVLNTAAVDPELVVELKKHRVQATSLRTNIIGLRGGGDSKLGTPVALVVDVVAQSPILIIGLGGVDVSGAVNPSLKTVMQRAAKLSGKDPFKVVDPVMKVLPDLAFKASVIVLSGRDVDLPLADLPAPAQEMLTAIYGGLPASNEPSPNVNLLSGVNLVTTIDGKKFNAKKPLSMLGMEGDLVVQGSMGGLVGNDSPSIILGAVLPNWNVPQETYKFTGLAFTQVKNAKARFYVKIVPGAASVGVEAGFLTKIDGSNLEWAGALEVMANTTNVGVYLAGKMKGVWLKPARIKGLAVWDLVIKCGGVYGSGGGGGKCGGAGGVQVSDRVVEAGGNILVTSNGYTTQVEAAALKGSLNLVKLSDLTDMANAAYAVQNGTFDARNPKKRYKKPFHMGSLEDMTIRNAAFEFVSPGAADPDLGLKEGIAVKGELLYGKKSLGLVDISVNDEGIRWTRKVGDMKYKGFTFDGYLEHLIITLEEQKLVYRTGARLFGDKAEAVVDLEVSKDRIGGTVNSKVVNTYDARVDLWYDFKDRFKRISGQQDWSAAGGGPIRWGDSGKGLGITEEGALAVMALPAVTPKTPLPDTFKWLVADGAIVNVHNGQALTAKGSVPPVLEVRDLKAKKLPSAQQWEPMIDGSIVHSSGQVLTVGAEREDGTLALKLAAAVYDTSPIPIPEYNVRGQLKERFKKQVETGVRKFMALSVDDHKRNLNTAKGIAVANGKVVAAELAKYANRAANFAKTEASYKKRREVAERHLANANQAYTAAKTELPKYEKEAREWTAKAAATSAKFTVAYTKAMGAYLADQSRIVAAQALREMNGDVAKLHPKEWTPAKTAAKTIALTKTLAEFAGEDAAALGQAIDALSKVEAEITLTEGSISLTPEIEWTGSNTGSTSPNLKKELAKRGQVIADKLKKYREYAAGYRKIVAIFDRVLDRLAKAKPTLAAIERLARRTLAESANAMGVSDALHAQLKEVAEALLARDGEAKKLGVKSLDELKALSKQVSWTRVAMVCDDFSKYVTFPLGEPKCERKSFPNVFESKPAGYDKTLAAFDKVLELRKRYDPWAKLVALYRAARGDGVKVIEVNLNAFIRALDRVEAMLVGAVNGLLAEMAIEVTDTEVNAVLGKPAVHYKAKVKILGQTEEFDCEWNFLDPKASAKCPIESLKAAKQFKAITGAGG